MKGLGVNKLPAEAVKYYKKAAEQGDAEAQYLLQRVSLPEML